MPTLLNRKVNTIMSGIPAERQNLADRLATALRRYEREAGDINRLGEAVGHSARDLRRWALGTTMPAEVLVALLDELPRHLADHLIGQSGFKLVCKQAADTVNALTAASRASAFSSDVAQRMADGVWCHRDEEAARENAQELITILAPLAEQPET